MLAGIAETLAIRKKQFKEAGVASLEQYEAKTKGVSANHCDSWIIMTG